MRRTYGICNTGSEGQLQSPNTRKQGIQSGILLMCPPVNTKEKQASTVN